MEKIHFIQKSIDIPAEYRPMYQIALVIMVLRYCSRNNSATLLKLHLFLWCFHSEENMEIIKDLINNKYQTKTPYWCIDPALNRALKYAVADGFIIMESTSNKNSQYRLTKRGMDFFQIIESDKELFYQEKEFLLKVGYKLSDSKITDLTTRKIGI